MRSLLPRLQDWLRKIRADAVVAQLISANEPTTTLESVRGSIHPGVVDQLLNHAWKVSKNEGILSCLKWVELAKEASLISGRPTELADCLEFRGILLQDLHEETSGADGSAAGTQLLSEALSCLLDALAIRERLDDQESLASALGHVSSVYHRLGRDLCAFRYRLDSLVHAGLRSESFGPMTRNLTGLFWSLSDNERREVSDLLTQQAEPLKQLARETDRLTRGDLLEVLGEAYRQVDQPEMSLQLWRQASTEYSASDKPSGAFYISARAQDLAYRSESPEEIVEFGLDCIHAADEGVSADTLASRYHLLAFGYDALGRSAEAIAAYHDAAIVGSRSEDGGLPGIYLLEAANLEKDCGMLEEARADFEKVLSGPAGAFTFWDAESGLAEVCWRKGDLGAAIDWCEEAVALSIVHRMNLAFRASSLHLSSFLHFLAGNHEAAIVRCNDLLRIFENGNVSPASVCWYYTNLIFPHCVVTPTLSATALLGLMAAKLGSQQGAGRYLDLFLRSFAQEQEAGTSKELLAPELDQLLRAESLLLIDPKQAIEVLQASLPALEHQGWEPIVTHRNLGLAHFILGDTVQARVSFSRVLELTANSPSVEDEIIAHFHLGLIEMHSGALEAAYDELSTVIRAKEAQRGSLADLDLRQGFPKGAYQVLVKVCMNLGRNRELVETVEKLKSRVLLDLLGSPDHRPIDYRATREFQQLKEEKENYNRRFLLETNEESMIRLENLMAEDSENAEARLMAGINLSTKRDELKERLLRRGFLLGLESQTSALSFDEIRDLCVSATHKVVLVEFLVTPTEVMVLGVREDLEHPELVVVPLSQARLTELSRSAPTGHDLPSGIVAEAWHEDMAKLLAPALAWSAEGDLLWFVPHGPLHGLPLHAVKVGGRYMIERNPVCYSPSASVMKYCKKDRTGRRMTALVLGPAEANDLPDARFEAQLVAEIFGTNALLGGEATKSRFLETLEQFGTPDILHFAGHSVFRSVDPLESALELAPFGVARSPYGAGRKAARLTAGEVLALRLRADLVTLSSCASGAQEVGPGDEPIGFARTFLYAGAASVLASLWPVNDLSTRLLMEVFYHSLKQGLTKAEALQRAQLRLLRLSRREVADFERSEREERESAADPRLGTPPWDAAEVTDRGISASPHPYSHPYFWAPFSLIGDWN